jgi:hypothetical protein
MGTFDTGVDTVNLHRPTMTRWMYVPIHATVSPPTNVICTRLPARQGQVESRQGQVECGSSPTKEGPALNIGYPTRPSSREVA